MTDDLFANQRRSFVKSILGYDPIERSGFQRLRDAHDERQRAERPSLIDKALLFAEHDKALAAIAAERAAKAAKGR